jgi:hypothetical protein
MDRKYLEKVKETFQEDMGFAFTDFLDTLSYFNYSFSETLVKRVKNPSSLYPPKSITN